LRWDQLFDDLEGRAAAMARADRAVDIADRSRIEAGRLGLAQRLAAHEGVEIHLRLAGGLSLTGRVQRTGSDWLLLTDATGADCLVFMPRVCAVSGLGRWTAPVAASSTRRVNVGLGVGHVLRALSGNRAAVGVQLVDGSLVSGTIDRVADDFVDVTVRDSGQVGRRRSLGGVTIPRDAISMIRSWP